jgi:acetyl-CoA carboxylase biotin carboxyl carrier protein
MDLKEIQDLIKLMGKNGVGKLEIKDKDFEIELTTVEYAAAKNANLSGGNMMPMQYAMPALAPTTQTASAPVAPANNDSKDAAPQANTTTIKSPMIGTFYRSSGPDKPVFVSVGDEVSKGQPICIIEAMKLFNEIESEVSGRIVKILIDDASPVEFDQPLFLVEPI